MAIDYKPEQNEYKNMTPFKTWLMYQINTWGVNNFPFLENDFDQLTNYGMMMKLMKVLNDNITNQNLVEEDMAKLYEAFTELQTYIDNYFDNLDVQEEIDNKLDQMVEDGTLPEIVASYLNSKAIFGFDNVESMKQATNLINGSFAKTLGFLNYQDGKGRFYKIRNKLTSDVIDEVNIISLTNSDTLIAELINEETINNIEINTNNIAKNKELINIDNNLFLGVFFDANNNNKLLFKVSKDGKNFITLKNNANIYGRDPSIVYFNDYFYIAVTNYNSTHDFIIYKSSDLINFETYNINAGLSSYYSKWAPDLLIDNNKLYCTITLQQNENEHHNIFLLECTNIENLTFGNMQNITPIQVSSCIDSNIYKDNNTYYLVITDNSNYSASTEEEISKIYSSNALNGPWTPINTNIFKTCYNVEGCSLVKVNDKWLIYGDSPLLAPYLLIETPDLATTDSVGNNIKDYIQPLYTLTDNRHGSVKYINDEEIKNKLYAIIKTSDFNINFKESENKITYLKELTNENITNLLIAPNTVVHVIGADSSVTNVYNPFRTNDFKIVFYASVDYGQVTFTNIQNNQGDMINKNNVYHNSNAIAEKIFSQSLELNCNKTYIP